MQCSGSVAIFGEAGKTDNKKPVIAFDCFRLFGSSPLRSRAVPRSDDVPKLCIARKEGGPGGKRNAVGALLPHDSHLTQKGFHHAQA
jgi:hypothetical protein